MLWEDCIKNAVTEIDFVFALDVHICQMLCKSRVLPTVYVLVSVWGMISALYKHQ